MPRNRTNETEARDAATKIAEKIGEALAHIVNRLESVDVDRERAYKQLLELQSRFNTQVSHLGDVIGERVNKATRRRTRPQSPRGKSAGGSRTSRRKGSKSAGTPGRARNRVKCGICGTPGHNARGHAKWQASRRN